MKRFFSVLLVCTTTFLAFGCKSKNQSKPAPEQQSEPAMAATVEMMPDDFVIDAPTYEHHDNGDISFYNNNANVLAVSDDRVILWAGGFPADTVISVSAKTSAHDIVKGDTVYINGTVSPVSAYSCEGVSQDITYESKENFKLFLTYDITNIHVTANIKYAKDGVIVFENDNRTFMTKLDEGYCVGDIVRIEGNGCKTEPVNFTLEDGSEITANYEIRDPKIVDPNNIAVKKPVIYLYPEKTTDVSVKLDVDGELLCVYPEYNGLWQVTADPDGTLTDADGRKYYCLYWEADIFDDLIPDRSVGFVVKGEDTAEFLRQKALALGLNEREANEFIIYWLPLMQSNPFNYVYFSIDEYKEAARLDIEPDADTVIRFSMLWQALDKPVQVTEQILPDTPQRNGFTVVEWGGAEIK